jgi:predicted permease
MAWIPDRYRDLRAMLQGERVDEDVAEELAAHLAMRVEENMSKGMSPEEARAEALRRFGDVGRYQRETRDIDAGRVREERRVELRDALAREARHALRGLARSPVFTIVAIGTLALGIGATTAIYTMLETVVLRPLPYADAGRLVSVRHPTEVPGTGPSQWGMSAAGYFLFRQENRTLEDLGAYTTGYATLVADGEAERVRAGSVTHSALGVLGARPVVGRLIGEADDVPGAPPVAMLGWDIWQRRYGGDPGVVGRVVETSGGPVEIVGVTARGFTVPTPGPFESSRDVAGYYVDLWQPLRLDPTARAQNSHQYSGVGRLKPGVTAAAAQRDLQSLTDRLPELFPNAYSPGFIKEYHFRMGVQPLRDDVLGERIARTLWVLFGAVGVVLLIACANVANLFLVRAESRRREAAVRAALGASRSQMVAHHLVESLMVALSAGALGVSFAVVLLRALVAIAPSDLPRLAEIDTHWTAIALGLALSAVAGIVLGLYPALRKIDTDSLREGSRGLSASPRQRAVRNGLVVAQMALALVLLAAAGLMARSFGALRSVRPGLDPSGVLTFSIALPGTKYRTMEEAAAFHRELQSRLAALPGVTEVGAATGIPLRDMGAGCAVVFREGRPYGPDEEAPCVRVPRVTPGFFAALGIRVQGRVSEWSDIDAGTGAVVVTKALADRLWPGEDPIGKGINSNGPNATDAGFYRVVGVVPELRAAGLDQPPSEVVFYPVVRVPRTWIWGPVSGPTFVLRTTLDDAAALAGPVRRILAELDPLVPLANATTMEQVVARSMSRVSFIMLLLGVASAIALLLSAVGIYGVISYLVGQRRGEIGVRIALGAPASQVATMIVGQSLRLALAGIAIGLLAALAGTRVLRSLLFEVSPTDPVVLAAVAALLLALAALASFAPARRAARVDPIEALRAE